MDIFLEELKEKRNELDGDIFEMLYTLSGDEAPQCNSLSFSSLSFFGVWGGGVFIVVSFTQGKGIIESIQLGGGGHSG